MGSSLSKLMLDTHFSKDFIITKMNLNNHNKLTNLKEHIQNIHHSLKLIIRDSDAMCKILARHIYLVYSSIVSQLRVDFHT